MPASLEYTALHGLVCALGPRTPEEDVRSIAAKSQYMPEFECISLFPAACVASCIFSWPLRIQQEDDMSMPQGQCHPQHPVAM